MAKFNIDNQRIAVIGAGVFGTALAKILAENNSENLIDLWSFEKSVSVQINSSHINAKYLPEVILPVNISSTSSLKSAVEFADVLFLTTPAKFAAEIMESVKELIKPNSILIICTKGLTVYKNEFCPVYLAAEKIFPNEINISVASGPSHVDELLLHKHTVWIYASKTADATFEKVDRIISNEFINLKISKDPLGAELGGILKNVAAILFGIIMKMPGAGHNLSGVLFAECVKEMHEIFTFYGVGTDELISESGIGDVAATCFSEQSRNRKFGEQVFQRLNSVFKRKFFIYRLFRIVFPRKFQEPKLTVKFLAEGAFTIKPLIKIANVNGLKIPLFRALFDVLAAKKPIDYLLEITKNPELYHNRSAKRTTAENQKVKRNFFLRLLNSIFNFIFKKEE